MTPSPSVFFDRRSDGLAVSWVKEACIFSRDRRFLKYEDVCKLVMPVSYVRGAPDIRPGVLRLQSFRRDERVHRD